MQNGLCICWKTLGIQAGWLDGCGRRFRLPPDFLKDFFGDLGPGQALIPLQNLSALSVHNQRHVACDVPFLPCLLGSSEPS